MLLILLLLNTEGISVNRIFFITFMVLLSGCSATQPAKEGKQLYLDQSVLSNKNSTAGWLAYGLALSAWKPVFLADGSPDYFNREVSAREIAAQIWKELKQNDASKSDPDLDILEAISDAGFMSEYLWIYLKVDTWKNPGTLELDKFKVWANEYLENHVPVKDTGVSVSD